MWVVYYYQNQIAEVCSTCIASSSSSRPGLAWPRVHVHDLVLGGLQRWSVTLVCIVETAVALLLKFPCVVIPRIASICKVVCLSRLPVCVFGRGATLFHPRNTVVWRRDQCRIYLNQELERAQQPPRYGDSTTRQSQSAVWFSLVRVGSVALTAPRSAIDRCHCGGQGLPLLVRSACVSG